MPGLFGLLNLGAQSLQVQRQGVEVAGPNLATQLNQIDARLGDLITTIDQMLQTVLSMKR